MDDGVRMLAGKPVDPEGSDIGIVESCLVDLRALPIGRLEYREIARTCREKDLVDDDALAERFIRITPQELHAVIRHHLGDVESLAAAL